MMNIIQALMVLQFGILICIAFIGLTIWLTIKQKTNQALITISLIAILLLAILMFYVFVFIGYTNRFENIVNKFSGFIEEQKQLCPQPDKNTYFEMEKSVCDTWISLHEKHLIDSEYFIKTGCDAKRLSGLDMNRYLFED